ncbi:hypothetical protein HD553DRAFT_342691 [Filobasidium floriforme]|uniref:uncharacterized protein n=1 Tax=Filobasidium floriforme TaxID=5210 RepID=UPI001E8ECB19|nr:uncharacterized protein HD553DRAFT_342691 [Filobasidium floriforme]KAH8084289.1 hypothetical protein HD553DRAFT_342691 [Filobasidium floriforme]
MSGLPPNDEKNKKSGGEKRKSTAPDDLGGKKRRTRSDARKEREDSSLSPAPMTEKEMAAEVERQVEEKVKAVLAETRKREAAEKRKKDAAEKKARVEKEEQRIRDAEKERKKGEADAKAKAQQDEIRRRVELELAREEKKKEVGEKEEKKEDEKDERGRSSSKVGGGETLEGVSSYKWKTAERIRLWKREHASSVIELFGDDRCEPCQERHRVAVVPPSEALQRLNDEFNRCIIGPKGRCSRCEWNGTEAKKCKYTRPAPATPADVKPDLPLAGPYSRFGSGLGFGANFDVPPAPAGGLRPLPTTPNRPRPGLTGLGLPLSPSSPSTAATTSRIANIGDRLTRFNEDLERAMERAQWTLNQQEVAHYFPSVYELVQWFIRAANEVTEAGQDLGRLANPRPDFSRR